MTQCEGNKSRLPAPLNVIADFFNPYNNGYVKTTGCGFVRSLFWLPGNLMVITRHHQGSYNCLLAPASYLTDRYENGINLLLAKKRLL